MKGITVSRITVSSLFSLSFYLGHWQRMLTKKSVSIMKNVRNHVHLSDYITKDPHNLVSHISSCRGVCKGEGLVTMKVQHSIHVRNNKMSLE